MNTTPGYVTAVSLYSSTSDICYSYKGLNTNSCSTFIKQN